jgi:hypothetical protein
MSSKTDIANLAIADHSGEWVSNIDTAPGRTADAIRAMWAQTLELALAQHPWKFAKWSWKDQAAVPAEENPDPDMAYAFRLPADCVRAFELRPQQDFSEWAGMIACNDSRVTIIGTRRGVDIGRFSAFFCDYLGHLLARRICTPITASEAIRKRCQADEEKSLADAKTDNGRAGTQPRLAPDSFVTARLAGGGGIPR